MKRVFLLGLAVGLGKAWGQKAWGHGKHGVRKAWGQVKESMGSG